MDFHRNAIAAVAALVLSTAAWSESMKMEHGGDTFLTGDVITTSISAPGDAFVSARTVVANGLAEGDLHVAGFDVTISTDTMKDLYAAGGTVLVRSQIASDLNAAGFSVRTDASSAIGRNARLLGRTVTIDGPIAGALSAIGQDVILNAAVEGDARIFAQSISFGPNASVRGTLTYSSTEKIAVPDRVAPAERVSFERLAGRHLRGDWDDMPMDMPGLPSFFQVMSGFVIMLLFFVALGALFLSFMPVRLEKMLQSIAAGPGRSILLGVIGLSMLFGMVPIIGLTIIGLPFLPIVLLMILVAWILGYALGAYSIAMWAWTALGGAADPGLVLRLAVFAMVISVIALLHFIPFVGWVVNYTLVLLGLGALTNSLFQYVIGNPGLALDVDLNPIEK